MLRYKVIEDIKFRTDKESTFVYIDYRNMILFLTKHF